MRREVQLERRALTWFRVDPDVAAGLAHDAVDRGEPEPGPLPHILGREERLEDVLPGLAIHPDARIAHDELGIRARRDLEVSRRGFVVERHALRGDGDRAAFGDRISRVDDQVDEDLVELAGVDQDRADLGTQRHRQPDVRPDQPTEHRLDRLDRSIQVGRPGAHQLPAAEGEQLSRQDGRAVGGHIDRRDAGERRFVIEERPVLGREILGQHVRESADREQHVVEVVGDPAREPTDRLQLLRLEQLRFDGLACADVARDRRCPQDPALDVADRRDRERHVDERPIPARTDRLEVEDALTCGDPGKEGRDLIRLIGRREDADVPADDVARRVSVKPFRPGVPARDRPIEALGEDRIVGRLDDRFIQRCRCREREDGVRGRLGARLRLGHPLVVRASGRAAAPSGGASRLEVRVWIGR